MGTKHFKTFLQFRQRYKKKTLIDEDHQAQTHLVYDTLQNKFKAQKIITINSKLTKLQILQDVKILAQLDHPHLNKIQDHYILEQSHQSNGLLKDSSIIQKLHIISEYVATHEIQQEFGRLTTENIINIYYQLKSVIEYIHGQSLLIKNINLDHIRIDSNCNIKLHDFVSLPTIQTKFLSTNQLKGRIQYRSPQLNSQNVSITSNMWAIGIILIQIIKKSRILKLVNKNPCLDIQFPNKILQSLDDRIRLKITSLLERDPKKRHFLVEQNNQLVLLKNVKINKTITKSVTNLQLYNLGIKNQGASEIATKLKNLIILDLTNNNIGKEGAIQIARNLTNLNTLKLGHNKIMKEGGIAIAQKLKNLKMLDLSGNHIKQAAIEISHSLYQLTQLRLYWNELNSNSAIEIARNLKNLLILDLSGNYINNEGAIEISKHLTNLRNLNLSTNSVTGEGAKALASNLQKIEVMNLGNNHIDSVSKQVIKAKMKNKSLWI